jgi:hypothetical protein
MRTLAGSVALGIAGTTGMVIGFPAPAGADAVGYLVNLMVMPGYSFADGDDALAYGYALCDKVGSKVAYASLVGGVKTDLATGDYGQAAYLINQAVEQLCPAQIWQLRQSAAGYTTSG